jgi:hypothetical protein
MIMRINPYVGISRMRRYRMVDMCKGKKYDYEALMTSSLSDCIWLEKEWKFRLSTTWHPSLHFYFSFTWFITLISFLPLLFSLFILFFNLSFILSYKYIYFYFSIFLSFISIHILFSLFFPLLTSFSLFSKLSTPLFLACTQSEF